MAREITSTFNIFKAGRVSHNNRPYALAAFKRLIEKPETKEALMLEELFGYYGHGVRAKTNKLRPDELEVIMVDGKPVALQLEPASVTLSIDIDDDGNVKHRQKILDTPAGKLIDAMEASGVGGWSWAVSGTPNAPKEFGGFDYVKQPNYIDNDKRQSLMLESLERAGVDTVEQLLEVNLRNQFGNDAPLILESINTITFDSDTSQSLQLENLMLESILHSERTRKLELEKLLDDEKKKQETHRLQREELLLEALSSLPILPTEKERLAFVNMSNEEDRSTVKLMFDGLSKNLLTLPNLSHERVQINTGNSHSKQGERDFSYVVDLVERGGNPFKGA